MPLAPSPVFFKATVVPAVRVMPAFSLSVALPPWMASMSAPRTPELPPARMMRRLVAELPPAPVTVMAMPWVAVKATPEFTVMVAPPPLATTLALWASLRPANTSMELLAERAMLLAERLTPLDRVVVALRPPELLVKACSPQHGEAFLDALLAGVRKHAGRETFLDDVCLVGVEIERFVEQAAW